MGIDRQSLSDGGDWEHLYIDHFDSLLVVALQIISFMRTETVFALFEPNIKCDKYIVN